jgi:uncharacterized delta-60 repeat protein
MRCFCVCMEQFESRTFLSAGALDPTYSPAFEKARMSAAQGEQLHLQLDGKMIHCAFIGPHDGDSQCWRTNPNGSLDRSFGSKGVIKLRSSEVDDFQTQADGKFVALIRTADASLQLRRYNAKGTPDRSFGVRAKESLRSTGDSIFFQGIAIQDDGKILAVGNGMSNGYIRRFNANGSIDTSFATGGTKTIPGINEAYSVLMGGIDIRRSDNRIVFSYSQHLGNDFSLAELQVLSPSGASEWNYEGAPMSNDYSSIGAVMVDGDGSIVVVGNAKYDANGDYGYHNFIVRHPPQNSTSGLIWSTQSDQFSGVLMPQADGHIFTTVGSRIARLNYNLTTDTSFASGGFFNTGWASAAMALQGDGKIVVDGSEVVSHANPDVDFHSLRLVGDGPIAVASKKILNVSGTAGNDQISISKAHGILSVKLNGLDPFLFSTRKIKRLSIDAGAGDDTITLDKSLPTASINGSDGDDTVIGKRPKDKLFSIEHS